MRAGWSVFVLAIALLIGGVASAQTTQPTGEIRRTAAASSASSASNASGPSATRVALSLAAVLALIMILFIAGRRFLPRGSLGQHAGGAVQVLARTIIAPKQRVILLQVGRRILVVADGGGPLNTLCEITDADEAAALIGQLQSERGGSSFSTSLSSAMERFRAAEPEPARDPQPSVDAVREEIEGLAKRVRRMAR
jgi:flagellar biogenesis protein FliO